MKSKEFIRASSERLFHLYESEEAFSIVKILVEETTSLSRTDLLLNADIATEHLPSLEKALARLESGEPLQYILEKVEFYGLQLKVEPGVLIPRPETEELVDYIVQKHTKENLTVLDCCTGSGCIALSLAYALPNPEVSAIELSETAIAIATQNASINDLPINFIQADLLSDEAVQVANIDLLVSNPPYVTQAEKKAMHPNVLSFEPSLALFVDDDDPLLFYRVLLEKGRKWVKEGGWIYFEINEQFGEELQFLAKKLGWVNTRFWKDLRGKNRFFEAKKMATS